jgi:hypothetical protein
MKIKCGLHLPSCEKQADLNLQFHSYLYEDADKRFFFRNVAGRSAATQPLGPEAECVTRIGGPMRPASGFVTSSGASLSTNIGPRW